MPEYNDEPILICVETFVQTILSISLKAKSINQNKYAYIVEFLDAYVNDNQKILIPQKKKWTF